MAEGPGGCWQGMGASGLSISGPKFPPSIPSSTQKLPTEENVGGGIHFCKDHDYRLKCFQNYFSEIAEIISEITETILLSSILHEF